MVTPRRRCLTEERHEFILGHSPQMIATRVVKMRYPRNVQYLEYKIRSNYNAYNPNASDKLGYRVIKSAHSLVKFLYNHGRACDRDAVQ